MTQLADSPKGTASIQTRTLEVKVLKVNNRQMTLSVFRQLPTIDPFDYAGEIWRDVDIWGRVRYDFKDYEGGYHVIFQKDGVLYRHYVDPVNVEKSFFHASISLAKLRDKLTRQKDMVGKIHSIKEALADRYAHITQLALAARNPCFAHLFSSPEAWRDAMEHYEKRFNCSWEVSGNDPRFVHIEVDNTLIVFHYDLGGISCYSFNDYQGIQHFNFRPCPLLIYGGVIERSRCKPDLPGLQTIMRILRDQWNEKGLLHIDKYFDKHGLTNVQIAVNSECDKTQARIDKILVAQERSIRVVGAFDQIFIAT